jgi:hypothetical protein
MGKDLQLMITVCLWLDCHSDFPWDWLDWESGGREGDPKAAPDLDCTDWNWGPAEDD